MYLNSLYKSNMAFAHNFSLKITKICKIKNKTDIPFKILFKI